jgi:hypothetical protein
VAYDQIAADLAAVYYAATLTRDPTLDAEPDPDALAAYHAKGRDLASALLTPKQPAVIHCPCGTRAAHPDRPARALVTVHDRDLLIVRESRGPYAQGLRLVEHLLVDIPMAQREGHRSARVYCSLCRSLHQLGFRWLRRARRDQVADMYEHCSLDPRGEPIIRHGKTLGGSPNDPEGLAFAETTGPLDGSTLLVVLPWRHALSYKQRFGFKPPHDQHLLRLIGNGDSRVELNGLRHALDPQWGSPAPTADPTEERQSLAEEDPLPKEGLPALQQLAAKEHP